MDESDGRFCCCGCRSNTSTGRLQILPCPTVNESLVRTVRARTTLDDSGDAYTISLAYDAVLVAALVAQRLANGADGEPDDSLEHAADALMACNFTGATGLLTLARSPQGGVARRADDTLLSVLTFPASDGGNAADARGVVVLEPAATVTLSTASRPTLRAVPGGASIVWPGGLRFPPFVTRSLDLVDAGNDGSVPRWLVVLLVVFAAVGLLFCLATIAALRRWSRRSRLRSQARQADSDHGFGVPYVKNLYGTESTALPHGEMTAAESTPPKSPGQLDADRHRWRALSRLCGTAAPLVDDRISSERTAVRRHSSTGAASETSHLGQPQRSLLGRAGQLVGLEGIGSAESRRASNSVTGSAALLSQARPRSMTLRLRLCFARHRVPCWWCSVACS